MIAIRELRKRLGGQAVLRGVTLQVERGEVVAVTGPSGTGKSVLLKHVVGLRAVINRPSIILYDEPTTGLDPANARTMYGLIRRIAEESGATSVVVTHDIDALGLFADRAISLTDGRVVTDAAPQAGR